jgi:nitrogen fixation protein NifB
MNCLPMQPVEGTPFESLSKPDHEIMQKVRWEASQDLKVVRHCAMCRADAAGRLGQSNSQIVHELLQSTASMPLNPLENRPYIAVASREGMLVNEHLGQAKQFFVYDIQDPGFPVVELRNAPAAGTGLNRWSQLADLLHDCKALIVNQTGEPPKAALTEAGIKVIVTEGLIEQALQSISSGAEPLPVVNVKACNGGGCGGKTCG